jgi:hypothetical protein
LFSSACAVYYYKILIYIAEQFYPAKKIGEKYNYNIYVYININIHIAYAYAYTLQCKIKGVNIIKALDIPPARELSSRHAHAHIVHE